MSKLKDYFVDLAESNYGGFSIQDYFCYITEKTYKIINFLDFDFDYILLLNYNKKYKFHIDDNLEICLQQNNKIITLKETEKNNYKDLKVLQKKIDKIKETLMLKIELEDSLIDKENKVVKKKVNNV